VGDGYDAPFRFNGRLLEAVVEVDGEAPEDPLVQFERIMAEQ
jgi:hypothetical protein